MGRPKTKKVSNSKACKKSPKPEKMTKKLKIQTTEAESLTQTECYVSETRPNRGHDTNDDACSVNSVQRHLELEKNIN
jgi:hypothetical protein